MQNYNEVNEVNLFDYWLVIKKRWRLIAGFVGVVTAITIAFSLVTPKYYRAGAEIMPVAKSNGSGMAALAGQFGGLASLVGVGVQQTPNQQLMALLKTRTLAEEIINKYDLMNVLFGTKSRSEGVRSKGPTMEDAADAIRNVYVKFSDDKKKGTIAISAEFRSPQLAADVVNGYVEGLQRMINENSFTVAKRNRIFIEGQLAQNKRQLLEAGKMLNEFYKGERVSSVDSKVDVPINILQAGSDEENQINANKQLEDINRQKEEVEKKISMAMPSHQSSPQTEEAVIKNVPQQVYLQYLTLRRNLLTQVNTLLTQQFEIAKIDETRDELAFQVIDPARVPESRCRPKRTQMVVMAFIGSLFVGIFAMFIMEYIGRMTNQMKERVKGEL